KELEAAKKKILNFNKILIKKKQNYIELQTKIKDLTKKVESFKKEVRILNKQKIVNEEREQVIIYKENLEKLSTK
ncbi:37681_t:CDS:1, partial [Gigaspora margarita]